jgi:hypothetical protein
MLFRVAPLPEHDEALVPVGVGEHVHPFVRSDGLPIHFRSAITLGSAS